MKKILASVLCLAMIASFSACGAAPVPTPSESEIGAVTQGMIANPMVELKTPDFKKAGFKVVKYPTKGYKLGKIYEINGTLGEMRFVRDDKNLVTFRVAKQTKEDISGLYYDFDKKYAIKVDNTPVKIRFSSKDEIVTARWDINGYTFNISCKATGEAYIEDIAKTFVQTVSMNPQTLRVPTTSSSSAAKA